MQRLSDRTLEGLTIEEHVTGDPAASLPLVVAFHGRGGTRGLPSLAHAHAACRVLVPHGPHVLGAGLAWSPRSATDHDPDGLARDLAAVAARVERAIDAVAGSTASPRVVLAGYSQGAMLALSIAARSARPLDVVVGAAWLPPALEPLDAPPGLRTLRAAHGTADPIVPFAPTEALFTRLRWLGVDVVLEPFAGVDHVASPAMEDWLARRLGDAIDRP
jgi:predicted esterase